MDNLKTIKFKEYIQGWFYKIDLATGDKISFPKKHGYYKEMLAWVEAGNVIEPAETEQESLEREKREAVQALEEQKKLCITYLNDSEKHVSNDPPYPTDVQVWKDIRKEWRRILKSDELQTVPPKPF